MSRILPLLRPSSCADTPTTVVLSSEEALRVLLSPASDGAPLCGTLTGVGMGNTSSSARWRHGGGPKPPKSPTSAEAAAGSASATQPHSPLRFRRRGRSRRRPENNPPVAGERSRSASADLSPDGGGGRGFTQAARQISLQNTHIGPAGHGHDAAAETVGGASTGAGADAGRGGDPRFGYQHHGQGVPQGAPVRHKAQLQTQEQIQRRQQQQKQPQHQQQHGHPFQMPHHSHHPQQMQQRHHVPPQIGVASNGLTAPGQDPGANISPRRYGRPDKLGLERKEFINVHRKDYTGRIELLQGSVEGLSKDDETDLLIVYLRERGQYKANRDSSLAALNRSGISLAHLEKESRPEPSYRRHYHCWLSGPVPKPRPAGFEYKRLLVYEDPGEELTRDDNIVLDIMKCLTTVIGGDVQIRSVLLPLSGALLSPSLRKHFVKAALEVSYAWMRMGLPLRTVKILLPDTDITKDIETFQKTRAKLMQQSNAPAIPVYSHDLYFSYAHADKDAATEMIAYLRSKNPSIRIFDAIPRDITVRQRGVVDTDIMTAITESRVFLSLLSDDYFGTVECTETFSLAYCRDFDSQGNFIVPLYWRACDLTPLARRLIATEGMDCRERSFEAARTVLDDILYALAQVNPDANARAVADVAFDESGHRRTNLDNIDCSNLRVLQEKLLMRKADNPDYGFEEALPEEVAEPEESVSQMFFDRRWRETWDIDFRQIVFGPRIGAGGFGEVHKCKYKSKMVAVKTLRHAEDDDPKHAMAEFMVEMKLMSKLKHPNIVTFIGASIHSPNLAILLEFMPGGSLYRAIHRRRRNDLGPFPLLKTVWIAYGVAKGMYYLHSQYPVVIHRDLKSPNILLGTNVREICVTDFGLSRLRVDSYVDTGPGGTPEWMAPELLRQDPFTEQSDVFSFGVILWELVVCEKPWKEDHPMQIVYKVGSRGEKLETPPPDKCVPELREMIVSCFAENPKRRPSFASLVDKLDRLKQSVS